MTENPIAQLDQLRERYDQRTLLVARETLGEFIAAQVELTRVEVGFGWTTQPDAPSEYPVLCAAYERSQATGKPLPISSENNNDSIYLSSDINTQMRFWHDVNHVRRGLSFELVDELELGLWHLSECEQAGFTPDTIVWQLLHADLVGQATVMAFGRRFPLDQRRFVEGCISTGYAGGLLSELWRTS